MHRNGWKSQKCDSFKDNGIFLNLVYRLRANCEDLLQFDNRNWVFQLWQIIQARAVLHMVQTSQSFHSADLCLLEAPNSGLGALLVDLSLFCSYRNSVQSIQPAEEWDQSTQHGTEKIGAELTLTLGQQLSKFLLFFSSGEGEPLSEALFASCSYKALLWGYNLYRRRDDGALNYR